MGNCCDGTKNDCELINFQIDKDKDKNSKKISSIDFQNLADFNTGINNIQEIKESKINNSPSNSYLSKKKLKLIIKQSKSLLEGKEYIINSLGLIDSKNKYNDGLTIFGDNNVINI